MAAWASSGQIDSTRVSVHRCFRARNPPPGHRKRPGPLQARVCIGTLGQGRLAPEGADYALPAVHVNQPAISRIGCANSRMAKWPNVSRRSGYESEDSWEARGGSATPKRTTPPTNRRSYASLTMTRIACSCQLAYNISHELRCEKRSAAQKTLGRRTESRAVSGVMRSAAG